MENVDERKDIKIVKSWESYGTRLGGDALIAKPNSHSSAQFIENLVAIQLNRVHTVYNKPIYLGFSVPHLSKWKMYNFHYEYMLPQYGDSIRLNYMNTDSLMYFVMTDDFYRDIIPDIDSHFDASEYRTDNQYGIPLKNKKVLGKFKDEAAGKIIKGFIGLKS